MNRFSVMALFLLVLGGCEGCPSSVRIPGFLTNEQATDAQGAVKTEDVKVGTGPVLDPAKRLSFHYTGYFADGKKFESSHDSGKPFEFSIGTNEVIPGWEKGIVGMRVGGIRKITIPPELAYGAQGTDGIPPDSTLTFEVEFMGMSDAPKPQSTSTP